MKNALFFILLCAAPAGAQNLINLGPTGHIQVQGILQPANQYVYVGVLSGLPATCSVGALAFVTGVTPGQNDYRCTATNTWTVQGNVNQNGLGNGTTVIDASTETGSDWAAKVNAADAYLGSSVGTIIVPSQLAGTATTTLSISTGRYIQFGPGTFTSTVVQPITNPALTLIGAGPGVTQFVFSGATNGFYITPSVATSSINIGDCSVITSNASGGKAIYILPNTTTSDLNIGNVAIGVTGSGAWTYGIWGNYYESSTLQSVSIRDVAVGIHLDYAANADTIINPVIGGTYTTGIELVNASDCWLIGGTIQGDPSTALVDIQTGGGLSTAGTHLEATANYGVKATGLYASFVGIEMTGGGYTSGFYVGNGAQFSLSNSYISINASTADIQAIGTSGSSGNPVVVADSFVNNVNTSAPVITLDGLLVGRVEGGTIQGNGDCIKIGATYAVMSALIENAWINPLGGSGYAVNAVSLLNSAGLTLISNRYGVSVASGRVLPSGTVYRGIGNSALNLPVPDVFVNLAAVSECLAAGTSAATSIVSCGASPTGLFSVPITTPTAVQVVTTAITPNSVIIVQQRGDTTNGAGAALGVTCNGTINAHAPIITVMTSTSFEFQGLTAFTSNPGCYQYTIIN